MRRYLLLGFLGILLFTFSFAESSPLCRCLPNQACWPDAKAWAGLAQQLKGRLTQPVSPVAACKADAASAACMAALQNVKNPFYLQSAPGNTESQGWLNAWQAQPSAYAVEAEDTRDIVAAVNFAREHNLRLAVKGAGHDYLGRSVAPDSLLIWTHHMRDTSFNPEFVPEGCGKNTKPVPAVTVSAGTRWLEAYTEATTRHHMYIQGGGCTTVGAAGGFTQGGGFGSYSKNFGTGAAGILQVKAVTADGKVVTANQCQNPDLFWAIRGGGGGTFAVVTQMTLLAHPLPKYFGIYEGTITARNDAAYQQLIQHFLAFYRDQLNNPHWGEQFAFRPDNKITIFMVSQGLTPQQAAATWQPLKAWIQQSKGAYEITSRYFSVPPTKLWNFSWWKQHHPELVTANTGPNARPGEFWWTPNSGEVFTYWYTYQSWWLPLKLLDPKHLSKTAEVFYQMSRLSSVALHINKGLAGASADAVARSRETAMNPAVFQAGALVLMSAGTNQPMVKPSQDMEKKVQRINKAMHMLRQLAPNAGTYVNEADYFLQGWQKAFWGSHYARLSQIKRRVDPQGLFYCHHCVGSEAWSDHGMCRKKML